MQFLEFVKNNYLELITIIACFVGFVLNLIDKIRKVKNAKNETERQQAINDINQFLTSSVIDVEDKFKWFNQFMKNQGKTAGSVKKEVVLAKAKAYAVENGYQFDEEYISKKIDEIVALTKQVNK